MQQGDPIVETTTPDKAGWGRFIPIAVIAGVALIGAIALRDVLTFETLRAHRDNLIAWRDAHYAATALSFVAIYIVVVAFSLPGALFVSLTGGFLFGTVVGTGLNVSGATLGATAIFLAARYGLGDWLSDKVSDAGGRWAKIKDGIDRNQWSMLFLIRLVPVVPFFVANLLPALLNVPLHRYVISTFFGIMPGALVFTSVGAGLGEVFATDGTPDLGLLFEPHVLLPILGLCALAALPLLFRAMTGRKGI